MKTLFGAVLLAWGLAACSAAPRKRVITSERAPMPIGPYSQAVQVGETVFVAGQIGIDPASGALVAGGVREETRVALQHLEALLAECGLELADVVSTTVFMADLGEFAAMNEIYATRFPSAPPARATVGVSTLPKGARVEIAAIAMRAR